MNDSRTLNYWKNGQIIRALLRTGMYGFGGLLGMFIPAAIVGLVGGFIIVSPALALLLNEYCVVVGR